MDVIEFYEDITNLGLDKRYHRHWHGTSKITYIYNLYHKFFYHLPDGPYGNITNQCYRIC